MSSDKFEHCFIFITLLVSQIWSTGKLCCLLKTTSSKKRFFFGPSRVWKVHQCYLLYILSVPLFISPFISKLIMKKKPFMYVRFRCSYRKQPKGFCYKTPLQWDQISWEMHHIISELAHSCVLKVILHMIVYLSISCATTLILIGIIISSHSITRKMSLINFVSSVCRRKNKLVW